MDKKLLDKIEAKFDSLTGVYERFSIEKCAKNLIKEQRPFSLVLIDGDNFKNVNDGYGHSVGDMVIQIIANQIKAGVGDKGFVGRFGGDEFILLIPDIVEYNEVWQLCRGIHDQFANFSVPDYPAIFITITTGLARFSEDGKTYEELFEKADKALYRGKQKGRSCFIIYLDSKHKNIKIHSSDGPSSNSMQQHNTIFSLLAKSGDLRHGLPFLLQFFTTTLMIDHVCIQGRKSMIFSEIYSLSKSKEFEYIDNALISLNVNKSTAIFYINDVNNLAAIHQNTLLDICNRQNIYSMLFAEISYGETFYGYLRADTTSTNRIWQNSDMDLLLTAAKAIGMVLHFQGKTLEDI